MARFIITTVSPAFLPDGSFNQIETTVVAPHREARAIRAARRIRDAGNRNVMLFRQTLGGNYKPISLKPKTYIEGTHAFETGFNTIEQGRTVEIPKEYRGIRGGRVVVGTVR